MKKIITVGIAATTIFVMAGCSTANSSDETTAQDSSCISVNRSDAQWLVTWGNPTPSWAYTGVGATAVKAPNGLYLISVPADNLHPEGIDRTMAFASTSPSDFENATSTLPANNDTRLWTSGVMSDQKWVSLDDEGTALATELMQGCGAEWPTT